MQLLPSRFLCYTLLLVTGWLLVSNIDVLRSQSVDLAHHYALAYRIAENFNLVNSNDPTLGEMNYYPRLSHIVAAIVGWPMHSTFLGLHIVSLLSLAAIWGAFIYMFNTLPRRVATASTLTLVLLLVVNRYAFHFDVHGGEIVGNYFYSQLVGQAVAILSMAVAVFLEVRRGRSAAYIFLIGVIAINTGVHLLPTLELLGLLGGLVLFNAYSDFLDKKLSVPAVIASLLIPVVALVGVVLNPAFSSMRKISENDGTLSFLNITYPTDIATLCVLGVILSLVLLTLHIKNKPMLGYPAVKYLALYGGAVSCLCLLQMVLVKYGMGSDYAVKKYVYGIVTHLFVSLALLISFAFCRKASGDSDTTNNYSLAYALFVAVSFYVVFNASLLTLEAYDLSDLVQLEKKLDALALQLPAAENGENDVVIGLEGISPIFDYLFSISIFKTQRELAISDVLIAHSLQDYAKYSRVITSAGVKKYDTNECRTFSGAGVSASSAQCLSERANESSYCRGRVDFSTAGLVDQRRLKGFGSAENIGAWIVGRSAEFNCILDAQPPSVMVVDWIPFVNSKHPKQAVKVLINGVEQYSSVLTESAVTATEIKLPPSNGDKLVISFSTPDSVSPQQLGRR
ncbi:hypothetical protein [Pseudomonas amygdali]|uniref:hypothetical protein n=1 Tax=Pseudomonas amygdali TaxID=47877 RepID=UPI0001CC242B|nr:hypothetical protein [Pseudomonas amygdali]KWT16064.1 hypothetical protein AL041_09135 [Pseudomonas amygdali pv. aesculi]KWT16563.1 hypothetical protein AL042_05600 [Pseudomonas amygdali pv. aesculi]KWT17601.1 hypothetical protein AL043_07335 [Pseudomonas amygdali pv. aesculi]KWT29044.1 hypothetical protein AL044_15310 [Pseudomonas amygdali pv. aesculi]KWT41306.1 hypothetical protein AL045_12805 [Pseudomonas amygdali pv. aesculi]